MTIFPDCPHGRTDCRLYVGGSWTTCMAFTQEFDRAGNLLRPDPNTVTTNLGCNACGIRWQRTERAGEVQTAELMSAA
jgi:hypothetical protein